MGPQAYFSKGEGGRVSLPDIYYGNDMLIYNIYPEVRKREQWPSLGKEVANLEWSSGEYLYSLEK